MRPPGCVIVIFGASGDLARRELVPSLFELFMKQLLPEAFAIIGTAQTGWGAEEFREQMRPHVLAQCRCEAGDWERFAERLSFVRADATSAPDADYAAIRAEIERVRAAFGIPDHVLFHLAVPAAIFGTIAARLGAAGLAQSDQGWRRLVVEKPFGADRDSALALDRQLRDVFGEDQIYRVDHFLGKETVQNMLVFRFANPHYEPIWNRNYIDHVQITVAESIGIGTRAGFYEQTGVVRDMVQNHLFQLLCMTAMEPPVSYTAGSLRDETAKVLEAVNSAALDAERDAVRGQYAAGTLGDKPAVAYREETKVPAGSMTATYAALKLTIDNWRWADVPFYLRTGKRMSRGLTEIAIHFKPTPHLMFPHTAAGRHQAVLVFEVQPEEGIVQTIAAKQPGPELAVRAVTMNFGYAEAFGITEPPRAYAWLLLDAMQGDQTLFARADWIDRAWQIVDPLIARWAEHPPEDFPNYAAGTPGPKAADRLLARDGRRWRPLETPPAGDLVARRAEGR
ncbi:MAG: glucose-6-phosphate dehydrogenase [Vicinamibacterales bacterium]